MLVSIYKFKNKVCKTKKMKTPKTEGFPGTGTGTPELVAGGSVGLLEKVPEDVAAEPEAEWVSLEEHEVFVPATINGYNLKRPKLEGLSKRKVEKAKEAYTAKLEAKAQFIINNEIDLVGMQEVFDDGSLDDLAEMLSEMDPYGRTWVGLIAEKGDPRGIHNAALSPHSMDKVAEYVEFPEEVPDFLVRSNGESLEKLSRGALHVRVRLGRSAIAGAVEVAGEAADEVEVDGVVVHYKSQLPSMRKGHRFSKDPREGILGKTIAAAKRLAEATAVSLHVQESLNGEGEKRNVIIMGDMNDNETSISTEVHHGPEGSEMGTKAALTPDQGNKHRLFNIVKDLPENERWSIEHASIKEMYDHMFVSYALLKAYWDNSVRALGLSSSDHRAVLGRFDMDRLQGAEKEDQ